MISQLSFSSAEVIDDPYPRFAEARGQARVQWHDGTGMWLAFGHAEANAVLRSRGLGRIWTPRWWRAPSLVAMSSGCARGWRSWPVIWQTPLPRPAAAVWRWT